MLGEHKNLEKTDQAMHDCPIVRNGTFLLGKETGA